MSVQTAQFAINFTELEQLRAGTIEAIHKGAPDNTHLFVQRGSEQKKLDVAKIRANVEVIQDDDLFACTDEDGITYKCTGAQFKEVWRGLEPDGDPNGILILTSGTLKVQGGLYSGTTGSIGRPEGTLDSVGTSFSKTYSTPGEYEFPMENMQRLSFYGSTSAEFDFKPGFDARSVQNMSKMFQCCYKFNGDISGWDTSNLSNMVYMFNNARLFNQDLFNWNTSNVTNLRYTFDNAHIFNGDISGWDTSKVTDFYAMFSNCRQFNRDIERLDTGAGANMVSMFNNCRTFNQQLAKWDVSNATNMYNMFRNATEFEQDISTWCVTKITRKPSYFDTSAKFYNKNDIQPTWGKCAPIAIPGALPVIGIQGGSSAVADYGDVIEIIENGACEGFDTPYKNVWQRETAVSSGVYADIPGEEGETYIVRALDQNRYIRLVQFFGDPALGTTKLTSNSILGTNAEQPFPHAIGVVFEGPGTLKVNVTKTTAGQAFRYEDETFFPLNAGTTAFSQSVPGFYLFESDDITAFNFRGTGATAILNLDVRSRMESITDASNMFYGLKEYSQDLTWWDVSNVTNMSNMFGNCWKFNGDIAGWNVDNVSDMRFMFSYAKVFNQDLSGWSPSLDSAESMFFYALEFNANFNPTFLSGANLTKMFYTASEFNTPIDHWDTSNVTNMNSLFYNAAKFNQELADWNVSSVQNMDYMFYHADSFIKDISSWCVPLIPSLPRSFNNYSPMPEGYIPQWGTCPPRPLTSPIIA